MKVIRTTFILVLAGLPALAVTQAGFAADQRPKEGQRVNIARFGIVKTWQGPFVGYPRGVKLQRGIEVVPNRDGLLNVRSDEGDCNLGIEWIEQRRFNQIVITFAENESIPADDEQQVQIWEGGTPHNGKWTTLITKIQTNGKTCVHGFELPQATYKVRILFKNRRRISAAGFKIYGQAKWRKTACKLEWGCGKTHRQTWDGRIEAYNGYVLEVRSLPGRNIRVMPDGSWYSAISGGKTEGVQVEFLASTKDKTILTVRSTAESFSFFPDDLENDGVMYLKDFGVLISSPDSQTNWANYTVPPDKTIRACVESMPEQTLSGAMNDVPGKKRTKWLALAAPCNRHKFAVCPDGSVFARLGWNPNISFRTNSVTSEVRQEVEKDYLPVLHSRWESGEIAWENTYVTTAFHGMGADQREIEAGSTVLAVRITARNTDKVEKEARIAIYFDLKERAFTLEPYSFNQMPVKVAIDLKSEVTLKENGFIVQGEEVRAFIRTDGTGQVEQQDGRTIAYRVRLRPGRAHSVYFYLPSFANDADNTLARRILPAMEFSSVRRSVVDYWENFLAQGATIDVPEERMNRIWRSLLIHQAAWGDYVPDTGFYHANVAAFVYGPVGNEGGQIAKAVAMFGHTELAKKFYEPLCTVQGTDDLNARVTNGDGALYAFWLNYVFNTGFNLWNGGNYYRFTAENDWLKRMAPKMVRACDWIVQQRKTTMKLNTVGSPVLEYGLFPPCGLEDESRWFYWLMTNGYMYVGMKTASEVLAEIEHPDAARIAAEAKHFKEDLLAAVKEAIIRCPVVKLRDGTYIPYVPKRLYQRGRPSIFYEAELGPFHYLTCELFAPESREASWILDYHEDEVFMTEMPGDDSILSFENIEKNWFNLGGYGKTQPYLVHTAVGYLRRDEIKQCLRTFYNNFVAQNYHDINAFPEHICWHGAAECKTYEEAMYLQQYRSLLVFEEGNQLWLAKAASRHWFEDGKLIKVIKAPTFFGEVSYTIESKVATGKIIVLLEPPTRKMPDAVLLRLRCPNRKPIRSVTVNGRPYTAFDADKELIRLGKISQKTEIIAMY